MLLTKLRGEANNGSFGTMLNLVAKLMMTADFLFLFFFFGSFLILCKSVLFHVMDHRKLFFFAFFPSSFEMGIDSLFCHASFKILVSTLYIPAMLCV